MRQCTNYTLALGKSTSWLQSSLDKKLCRCRGIARCDTNTKYRTGKGSQ